MIPRWLFIVVTTLTIALIGCTRGGGGEGVPGASSHGEEAGGEGDHHADEGHEDLVELSDAAKRSADLQVSKPEVKALARIITAPASLTLTQRGIARVAARVPGHITALQVQPGDAVEDRQILAFVDSPEVGSLRADYLAAATRARVARSNYEREMRLFEKGISSEREARQAEEAWVSARADGDAADAKLHSIGLSDEEIEQLVASSSHQGARFPLRSPIAGTVLEVNAAPGESVEPAENLFTVGQLDELWALLQVAEGSALELVQGQQVTFSLQAAPNETFEGVVDYVGAVIDPKTRSVQVRVVVPNQSRRLKPGMFATAEIAVSEDGAPQWPVVPRAALQKVEGRDVVFVQSGPNQFRAVEVRVGASTRSQVEILDGLQGDELVVTSGAFILKSELSKESMGDGHSH